MAAPVKFPLSKSNLMFLQNYRFLYTCPLLMKYNIGPKIKDKKKRQHPDNDIRFGKHENDTYETGMTLTDRFIDPAVQKTPVPHPESPGSGKYLSEHPYGKVYDKKPFPLVLKAGKRYLWCACGRSNRQPICDGTHKMYNKLPIVTKTRISMYPIIFEVEEDGEYWMCNCKQSKNRPFCDGTHRKLLDQEKHEKTF